MRLEGRKGPVQIVLLTDDQSLALWKQSWGCRERVFLTCAGLVADGDNLRLTSTNCADLTVAVYPMPDSVESNGGKIRGRADGLFTRIMPRQPEPLVFEDELKEIQPAGPPREIPLGKIDQPVAAEPEDTDFKKAAVWRVTLPKELDLNTDPLLRIHYTGDVARVTLNGKLLTDDFFNGSVFEIGLRRYAPEILTGDLHVEILPLRPDAPILLAKETRPDLGHRQSVVALHGIEIVPRSFCFAGRFQRGGGDPGNHSGFDATTRGHRLDWQSLSAS